MQTEALEFFFEIAQGKTFFTVAEDFNLSQSALSKSMKKLESELGVQLLERDGRSVKLTPAGQQLMQDLETIQPQWQLLKRHIRQMSGNQRTTIWINLPGHVLQLRTILENFQQEHPEILLSIGQTNFLRLKDTTPDGISSMDACDLLVIHRPLPSPHTSRGSLRYDMLYEDAAVAIMTEDHPLARKETLLFTDLITEHIYVNNWSRHLLDEAIAYTGAMPEQITQLNCGREEHIWKLMNSRKISLFYASDVYMLKAQGICIRLLEDLPMQPIILVTQHGSLSIPPRMYGQQLLRQYILDQTQLHPFRLTDFIPGDKDLSAYTQSC